MTKSTNSPFLVEVLGVAGSGKSTITSRLLSSTELERAPFISARNPQHLIQMTLALPNLTPLVLSGLTRKPRMSWADFKLMVFVTRWSRWLEDARFAGKGLIFDQGPIYALVRLEAKDLGLGQTRAFQIWRQQRLLDWVPKLATIIWLDAPDDVLISRIDQRDQSHWVKGETGDVSRAFVRRYRGLFLDAIREIERLSAPQAHRFDTSAMTVDEIATELSNALIRS